MEVAEILKEALPYTEEVITGLFMEKGEIVLLQDELLDIDELETHLPEGGMFAFIDVQENKGKMGCVLAVEDAVKIGGKMLGMEDEQELTDDIKDAYGEFMNQFWGRLRLEFVKKVPDIEFSQPEMEVLSIEDIKNRGFTKFVPAKIKFENMEVDFYLLFDEDILSWFSSLDEPQQQEEEETKPAAADAATAALQQKDMVKISQQRLDMILDIELPVVVSLGKCRMKIKDVLKLGPGSLIELDRSAEEYVDLIVNGKVIARGEVVVVESNFALRIKEIVSKAERLKGLRG